MSAFITRPPASFGGSLGGRRSVYNGANAHGACGLSACRGGAEPHARTSWIPRSLFRRGRSEALEQEAVELVGIHAVEREPLHDHVRADESAAAGSSALMLRHAAADSFGRRGVRQADDGNERESAAGDVQWHVILDQAHIGELDVTTEVAAGRRELPCEFRRRYERDLGAALTENVFG